MKLMTKAIEKKMYPLGHTDGKKIKTAYLKLFTPWGNWTWYGVEYDPQQRLVFGFVEGNEKEWGYFSLDELESIKGPYGLGVERDRSFTSAKISITGEFIK